MADNGWTWTSQRCGRYAYRKVLVHTTNPDHLVPTTPSPMDIPALEELPGTAGTSSRREQAAVRAARLSRVQRGPGPMDTGATATAPRRTPDPASQC
jgi:hypothetical protein